jgi:hypothetical protein
MLSALTSKAGIEKSPTNLQIKLIHLQYKLKLDLNILK